MQTYNVLTSRYPLPEQVIAWLQEPQPTHWHRAFEVQKEHNPVYARWLDLLRPPEPKAPTLPWAYPHLPISAFKHHQVLLDGLQPRLVFRSSGTTGRHSRHYVAYPEVYDWSLSEGFRRHWGPASQYVHIALLPGYEQRPDSSLIYMVRRLMQQAGQNPTEWFVGLRPELLPEKLEEARRQAKPIILWSVPYALLDLVRRRIYLGPDVTIIETGGMKGRGPEWHRAELHAYLHQHLHPQRIESEYGMTELLSQAYTQDGIRFAPPPWMHVWARDLYWPGRRVAYGKQGVLCVADLANFYSCPFIETEDIGIVYEDGTFEVLGRLESCEIRGCNLLYDEFSSAG